MERLEEFQLIGRWLSGFDRGPGVMLGIGDDAAVLRPPLAHDLAMTVDSLVAGTHFPVTAPAADVGHRALAVNLSDLAAMGATPLWGLLALTLPSADEPWLAAFAAGFRALAERHAMALVGGNLSRGPLMATVQVTGTLPPGRWLGRDGGRAGDVLLVSGWPGEAAAGLELWEAAPSLARDHLVRRYLRPEPRVALGQAALGVASAAIDISDDLLADLGHLTAASGCGAEVELSRLPLSDALRAMRGPAQARHDALYGGDDYELLLTCPAAAHAVLAAAAEAQDVPLTRIGQLCEAPGVRLLGEGGEVLAPAGGFRHF